MRSAELQKCNETALQKRLRHRTVVCHMVADLIGHCGEDGDDAHEIGRRVTTAVNWGYTGVNGEKIGSELPGAIRQRLITMQVAAQVVGNAAGKEDAQEIVRLFLRGIDWAWGEGQRDLRLVC